jgi:hypothetical protein
MDRYRALLVAVSLWIALPAVHAGFDDLEINCVAKKYEETTKLSKGGGDANVTKEQWGYEVTLENKTFKDLTGLEIKYITYYKQAQLGSKAAPVLRHKSGSSTIETIKGHEKSEFKTDKIELKKSSLAGGYTYADGAKISVQDALAGLWIRVYQNGAQIAEFAKPSSLPSKEKWQ